MYRTWTGSAADAETVARSLEAHLNEYAEHVISVSYAVGEGHYVLAVYTPVEITGTASQEAAVEIAEEIIDQLPR